MMNRETGKVIEGVDLVRQACLDVLATVVGERVMRLDYGSRLLDSVDDTGNALGKSRLLGRTADPIIRWEGDRVDLTRVDVEMLEPGKAKVSLEGTTDAGLLRVIDESLVDDRVQAKQVYYESLLLGVTTLDVALDNLQRTMARTVKTAGAAPPAPYVFPVEDPLNAAAVSFRGANLQSVIDELLRSYFVAVDIGVDKPFPSIPSYTAADPNALGIAYQDDSYVDAKQGKFVLGGTPARVYNVQAVVWVLEFWAENNVVLQG